MTRFRTSHIVPLAVLAVAAALPVAAAAPAAAATTYTIANLGSLGSGGTEPSAINANGQVTGYSYLAKLVPTPECPPVYGNTKKTCVEHPWHAFSYSNGQMTDLGTLSGDFSEGSAINGSGQVAGWSATKNGGGDAVVWNGSKMLDLGQQAALKGSSSIANGINDSGQVVGEYGTINVTHAFLYSNGTTTSLPEPSFAGSFCAAAAINNTGQIAGACTDTSGNYHLVLWQNGMVTDLGTLAGTPGTEPAFEQAISINNNGQISGTVFNGGATEGFLYSNGTITSLGSFTPAAINDNGVMVGGPDIDSGGTAQDLNTLLPAGSPTIQDATAINNNGQITATANNGAVLLTPA